MKDFIQRQNEITIEEFIYPIKYVALNNASRKQLKMKKKYKCKRNLVCISSKITIIQCVYITWMCEWVFRAAKMDFLTDVTVVVVVLDCRAKYWMEMCGACEKQHTIYHKYIGKYTTQTKIAQADITTAISKMKI